MAIQVNMSGAQTNYGGSATNAYARIVSVHHNSKTGQVDIAVDVFYDRNARDAGKTPIYGGVFSTKFYQPDLVNDNGRGIPYDPVVDQLPTLSAFNFPTMYTYLKSLPVFNGAVDV